MMPRLLRAFAIVLAIVAVIDPAITSARRTKPVISVVAADVRDSALASRVARALGGSFTVIPVPFGGAAGTVVAGTRVPAFASELASPVFAVLPEPNGPVVTLERVTAPARAPLEARTPVTVAAHVNGARGRRLNVALRVGDLVVDRATRAVVADDERVQVPLAFVPTAVGPVSLRVTAELDGGVGSSLSADVMVDVRDQRWAVLFYDPRPSWMSTFVRRAVERDPRFVVTSRVVTSRNVSTDAGTPPSTLDDVASLEMFDAIVVGAPDKLTAGDVAGLDAFLRRRGGGVVLLFDERVDGAYERLTEVARWSDASGGEPVAVEPVSADSGGLRATEMAWPDRLPAGAVPVAWSRAGPADSTPHPIVWRSAVGAGRLVVSGALDAWRFRDPATSGFDRFWQTAIADAADAGAPPIDIHVESPLLAPGEPTDVIVTLRDASLAQMSAGRTVRSNVTARLESPTGGVTVRLWPDGPVGQFRGSVRAPNAPGVYRVTVSSDGVRASAPVVVAPAVHRATPDERAFLGLWVGSRGGTAQPVSRVAEIRAALERAVPQATRVETWHPMRSGWWVVPFVLALGGEWWGRRRRGLA